jgi:hypothetical protein
MSRNIYSISYDINFENGPEDQMYTNVILLHPSGKRVEEETNSAIELYKFRSIIHIQGVTGGMCHTSGGCSLC